MAIVDLEDFDALWAVLGNIGKREKTKKIDALWEYIIHAEHQMPIAELFKKFDLKPEKYPLKYNIKHFCSSHASAISLFNYYRNNLVK